jgi:aspartate/methionine/tyrosine aminotransferase
VKRWLVGLMKFQVLNWILLQEHFMSSQGCLNYWAKKFGGKTIETSLDLSMYLLEEGLVSTVPGDAFGLPGYIRFSYAAAETDLQEAVRRVKEAVARLED